MKLWAKGAAIVCIAAFVLIYGFLCWPTVCIIRFYGWLARKSESNIRSRIAECAHWWGTAVFVLVRSLFRLKVETSIEGDVSLIHNRPFIIISNHQSTMDIAVMAWLIGNLGQRNVRWVMKRQLRDVPVIGWIARRIGCAFVSREKNPADSDSIRECARVMREDGAGIILFPEGTRFSKARAESSFLNVLPPKHGGFRLLHESLPGAPVVSVTISWNPPVADGVNGKTIFQAADFYGKSLCIAVRIVPSDEIKCPDIWLMNDWKQKDRSLTVRIRPAQ